MGDAHDYGARLQAALRLQPSVNQAHANMLHAMKALPSLGDMQAHQGATRPGEATPGTQNDPKQTQPHPNRPDTTQTGGTMTTEAITRHEPTTDLVHIVLRRTGLQPTAEYAHLEGGELQDDTTPTSLTDWRPALEANSATRPVPGVALHYDDARLVMEALQREFGTDDKTAGLEDALVTAEDDCDRLATELVDMRGERDQARAEAVGLGQTLEAVRAHLADVRRYAAALEAFAHPRIVTGLPEGASAMNLTEAWKVMGTGWSGSGSGGA